MAEMKIIKRINNRDYKINYTPVPAHKLPEKIRESEKEKLQSINSSKINLKDVTFMIPLRIESEDRKRCLTIVIDYLIKHFDTKILVLEEGAGSLFPSIKKIEWEPYVKYIYRNTDQALFYKTLDLNIMSRHATTPIICALDSDCIFYPRQYVQAANKIRLKTLDFCYPFNQPNFNIRKEHISDLERTLDPASVHSRITPPTALVPPGGCFFMNKEKFIEGGMENQNMISYGPEDTERRDRMTILGYNVGSIDGPLFHIDHSRTTNSNDHNPLFIKNTEEYRKVKMMSRNQLRNYVSTWEWTV